MKKTYMKNICLSGVLAVFLLAGIGVRAFLPHFILPRLEGVTLVGISLAALVIAYYLTGPDKTGLDTLVLGAVSFGLLPVAACWVSVLEGVKLAALGGAVFAGTAWLFDTMTDRISTGPVAKAAPIVSAFGLYLAAQWMMGIL